MPSENVVAKKAAKPVPLGLQIDALFNLRESLRDLQAQEKAIETKIKDAEAALMELMEKEGVEKSTGKKATVSVSETIVGNVEDWDLFWSYILKSKQTHLLQRRVSDPAIRELFEQKGKVPGVVPFTKRRLNLRAA